VNRGSWFAQQGGAGLRFGGFHANAGLSSRNLGRPGVGKLSHAAGKAASPRTPLETLNPPETGPRPGSPLSDALDDLLSHAQVTLKHLESIRAQSQQPRQPRQQQPQEPPSSTAHPRQEGGASRRHASQPHDGFWRPRCQAHLWGDGGGSCSGGSDSDSDLLSTDSEDESDPSSWAFLHAARDAEAELKKARAAGAFGGVAPGPVGARATSQGAARAGSQGPRREPAAQRGRGGSSSTATGAGAGTGAGTRQGPAGVSEGSRGTADRGQRAGFQFGGQVPGTGAGAQPRLAGGGGEAIVGPEAEVTATLTAAQANGPSAVRKALKRLLLRWHPDKAPQGDGQEAVAAQAEATRVLRFILQERERLGI